jgi:ubiquinone/menaquinone biosynthesis C-methylase UbiE
MKRPFYYSQAKYYDLIIPPKAKEYCTYIDEKIQNSGFNKQAKILDAGCGTGSYSIELASMGYNVTGVDLSDELINVAIINNTYNNLRFNVADLKNISFSNQFDIILCRGVLNDILLDDDRDLILGNFSKSLVPCGMLIIDVREWENTKIKNLRNRVFKKDAEIDNGSLKFTSVSELDEETRLLNIKETHAIVQNGTEQIYEYNFKMRCWTFDEIKDRLDRNGFTEIQYFNDYTFKKSDITNDKVTVLAKKRDKL